MSAKIFVQKVLFSQIIVTKTARASIQTKHGRRVSGLPFVLHQQTKKNEQQTNTNNSSNKNLIKQFMADY